jgi:M6 family metalloprotease-like protein
MQDRWTTPNTTKDGNRHRVGQRCGAVLALLLAGLLATVGQAAYLEDVPQTLVQPDGTVVSCFASGDEFYHWLHDADGYVIVKDPATGYFAYATKVGDELVASDCLAGSCDPRTLGVEPRLRPGRRILEQRRAAMAQGELVLPPHPEGAPTFTSLANIVIFVRFSDQAEFTNPLSTYNSFFNASSGVSLLNYFKEASYNQTTITSTFYPTSGGTAVVSYRSPNPRAYYQKYDATTNPQGYNGDDERTAREHELVKAAVDAIAAQVPTSLNLDTNGDGNVDNVVLIVRGGVEGWSDLLWPHRWSLYTRTAYINGKRVYAYNFQLDDVLSVSVLCHEMGHTLGAPDLYHYDDCSSAPDLYPVWRWDLMANNRNPPQHSGAYVKKKWFGWISTIPEITTSGTYTLNPITSSTNNAYRIASPNSTDEYFVLEYRRATGTFETSLPGSGLLVYRVYPNANPSAPGNRCGPPDEVYVYRPNGTTTANGDPASAPFSADSGRTAINDSTNPSSFLSNGSPGGLNISNVTSVGNTISFTVTLGGGGCTYSISPTSASVPAAGGSGTVTVTAGSGCTWTATSNAGWITVTSGASGSGNGSVGYSVAANAGAARTGTLTIAGQTFTVNQAGSGGGGGEVTVFSDSFEGGLAGNWSVSGTTTWGYSTYRAASGSGSAWCAGGGSAPQSPGQNYVANQNSWMVYGPFSLADATAASAEFDLWFNTESNYDFVKWMISVNGTNFSGYQTSGNSGGWQHVTFNFADVTSLTAIGAPAVWFAFIFRSDSNTQYEGAYVDNLVIKKTTAGGGCTYSISPTSASVPATGGSGTVTVTAGSGCTWTATSNAGWITVTSGASGSGNGSVGYSVAGNAGAARTGTLTIAGQTFTVNQGAGGGGGAYTYYVPAMAHNPGSSGTQWRSDLAVANTSSSTANLTLTYYSSSSPVVRSTTLAGNGTTKWGNVLESLFGVASGTSTQGTVVISANVPLAIVARTYNQAPSGTYGQFYPAVRSAHTIASGQTACLPGLEKSTAFRTNVGAINLGSSTCTVQFGVYTGSGVQVGSNVTLSVPAERWAQLNDLFGTAGAGNQSVAYAKVQPVSSGCQIWAYASVVDNATGDPTTVPMIVP